MTASINHRDVDLILAAHGSTSDARVAAPVLRHARQLADRHVFREVRCVFLKQSPGLDALDEADHRGPMVVVPMLTADGYYARQIADRVRLVDHRPAYLTPVVGTQPAFFRIMAVQIEAACGRHDIDPADTDLLVVGHGTTRAPEQSGRSTRTCAAWLTFHFRSSSLQVAFLDQPPFLRDFDTNTSRRPLVVAPFLVASGPHCTVDLPRALRPSTTRTVVIAEPAGEHPECADAILELARDAIAAELEPLR